MTGDFYIDFLYLIIYSFLGWIAEVIYCSIPNRHFINRGFLNGPLCPIYGFGALLVITILKPFSYHVLLVFIVGLVLTGLLEYITSFVMEKLFHARWWDYSKRKYNINGRVCLLNASLFGGLCVVTLFFIHPLIEQLVEALSYIVVQTCAILFIIIGTVDLTLTVQVVYNLNEKLEKLKELSIEIKEHLDEKQLYIEERLEDRIILLRQNIQENKIKSKGLKRLSEEFHQIQENTRFIHRRLIKAFPKMESKKFQMQLKFIQAAIKNKQRK
ncbi:hypothetical protein CS063_17270 [Sporanaerobium hydrogeniformans]|uniref:Uncharacterized protein n=1 Tax=Sporanaerobium hydrogeniformans TaxID=3072179 RepID=A0AC61D912_9FIRM|nr:hypothetical protein [Sporanaerobium hydrogeniformans]PHV69186.1 hypothetical protein CS063_17270 [Sporanaerobium hydrogeniformans]